MKLYSACIVLVEDCGGDEDERIDRVSTALDAKQPTESTDAMVTKGIPTKEVVVAAAETIFGAVEGEDELV